jgi:hypothetical protein
MALTRHAFYKKQTRDRFGCIIVMFRQKTVYSMEL